jgi:dicarboxylate/amino acid:cation (Na+ or H+) symporter, DAACS family
MAASTLKPTRILAGLVVGAIIGIICNQALGGDHSTVVWCNQTIAGPLGAIFLRLLFMVVIPLVFCSVVSGIAGMDDVRTLGRLGGKTLGGFVLSTLVAAAVGFVLVVLIGPGHSVPADVRDGLLRTYAANAAEKVTQANAGGMSMQVIVDMIPKNPIKAAADGDMLAVLCFAALFGVAMTALPQQKRAPLLAVLNSITDVLTHMVGMALLVAPVGVAALAFGVTSRFGWSLLLPLSSFVITVLAGLLVHSLLVMGGALKVAGISPWWFFQRVRSSLITAFSTSSSSATLPTNLKVATEQLGIAPGVAGFVLPVGSTMCMNGTALFEGVTVLFLCQVFGVELSVGQQFSVLLLAVVTAIGAAGVPGGSIPLLIGILVQVGVPAEGIAIVLGVDRILDMCRTTVNVWGDLIVTALVAKSEGWTPQVP